MSGKSKATARLCVVAAGLLGVFGALALDVFAVAADRPAAILFPARLSSADASAEILAAGGLPVTETRLFFWSGVVWIAAPGAPDFLAQIKARGALAVINPLGLGGCLFAGPR
jgi:hypothetical protein